MLLWFVVLGSGSVPAATRYAPWIALGVSILALLVSGYQYWRAEWSPFSLTVMPPAITQTNDASPSLVVDMVVWNGGARSAIISDLTIHLRSNGKDTGIALHAQKILNREAPLGTLTLDLEKTIASVFLPILVGRKEAMAFRLYCAPYESDSQESALSKLETSIRQTNQIQLDLSVNGKIRPGVFLFTYLDFREKFKGEIIDIPKQPFAPRWYRTEPPVVIR